MIPEGVMPGDTFQELCEFRLEKDGVCMVKMGDADMETSKNESKPDYKSYVNDMAKQPEPQPMES